MYIIETENTRNQDKSKRINTNKEKINLNPPSKILENIYRKLYEKYGEDSIDNFYIVTKNKSECFYLQTLGECGVIQLESDANINSTDNSIKDKIEILNCSGKTYMLIINITKTTLNKLMLTPYVKSKISDGPKFNKERKKLVSSTSSYDVINDDTIDHLDNFFISTNENSSTQINNGIQSISHTLVTLSFSNYCKFNDFFINNDITNSVAKRLKQEHNWQLDHCKEHPEVQLKGRKYDYDPQVYNIDKFSTLDSFKMYIKVEISLNREIRNKNSKINSIRDSEEYCNKIETITNFLMKKDNYNFTYKNSHGAEQSGIDLMTNNPKEINIVKIMGLQGYKMFFDSRLVIQSNKDYNQYIQPLIENTQ